MYIVYDYFQNPFGTAVYATHSLEDAQSFCTEYEQDPKYIAISEKAEPGGQ